MAITKLYLHFVKGAYKALTILETKVSVFFKKIRTPSLFLVVSFLLAVEHFAFMTIIQLRSNACLFLLLCFHWFLLKNTKEMFSYFKINFWRLKRHFSELCRSYDPPPPHMSGVFWRGVQKAKEIPKNLFLNRKLRFKFFWYPLYFPKIQRI